VFVKIYTGQGDQGMSGLLDGRRVPKNHPLMEICGTLDELNCHLGVAIAHCRHEVLQRQVQGLQSSLLALGADLAAGAEPGRKGPHIGAAEVTALEAQIDAVEASLPALKRFLLPGGSVTAAELHVARTVCRRAERHVAGLLLGATEPVDNNVLLYLNRFSDLLFVLARLANQLDGVADVPWFPADSPNP
jgi:cob(I)alamin adenosyltransferase